MNTAATQSDAGAFRIARTLLADASCVLVFVAIGARNHHSGGGLTGILGIGAPFWIALAVAHGVVAATPSLRRNPTSTRALAVVWMITVAGGMLLRGLAFGDGTAAVFIVVTATFLGATMSGWRAVARRR